jgi:hypothetical protein
MLFRNNAGTDFKSHFTGASGENIPLGDYLARIETESGGPIAQYVSIRQEDCLLILARNPLTIEYRPGHAPVLTGRLASPSEQEDGLAWAKLCGVYLDGCATSPVRSDGSFAFVNIIPGSYTISILGMRRLNITELVDIHDAGSDLLIHGDRSGRDRIEVQTRKR